MKCKNKGITLISLVVTIIVLLILAGVSISMLTGENSILMQATKVKKKNEETTELERVQLTVTSALAQGHGTLNEEYINISFQEEFGQTPAKKGTSYVYESSLKKYVIFESGDVIALNKNEHIGATLEYSTIGIDVIGIEYMDERSSKAQVTEWQIFDIEDGNIYLIAKDFIKNPTNGKKNMDITDISDVTNGKYKDGASLFANADSNAFGKLSQIADKWLNKYTTLVKNETSNENKIYTNAHDGKRMTAYMLDTTVWKNSFIKKDKNVFDRVDYIIGGPTIEMLCDSFNKKKNLIGTPNAKSSEVLAAGTGYNWQIFGSSSLMRLKMI